MKQTDIQTKIESSFRKQVQKDPKVKNAYLLVHSEKTGIDLNLAEGTSGNIQADIHQPNHLASVGKLFTATLIAILHERKQLDFNDPIAKHLDGELMSGLHVFKGKDYSDQIQIRHLLMQTSGLRDVFFPLWKKMANDPGFRITSREAVVWGKEHLKPAAKPGNRHFYTDTNYYLLGLIIENRTGKAFHEAMHELIFEPLGMQHAFIFGYSKPKVETGYPTAKLYIKGYDMLSMEGIHQIDLAGGGVTAPLPDFLIFMKALVHHQIIHKETLDRMVEDDRPMGFPMIGFHYGYSIWKMKTIPLVMPKKYSSWGCVGITGAFMFYHPLSRSYLIGSFNDHSYRGKALRFMAGKVIKELLR